MAESLRERNKSRTRRTIIRAGLRLIAERGFDGATIPLIAKTAAVSPRTVSYYFPVKADIAMGPISTIIDRLEASLASRAAGTGALEAIATWLANEVAIGDETGDDLVRRAIAREPLLQVRHQNHLDRAKRLMTEALAADFGLPAAALEPRIAGAAAIAVVLELWTEEHIAATADFLPRALAALAAANTSLNASRPHPKP
ncbi:MAG: TetR/AcrR family transcriptional regulator [Bifidobacteriaceae bacterium]|jgi:AcrR family transcriptional regulator|nr:TetR/AcrR family transcriptional regulator [Bifidobacteriaceae bacterium]